MAVSRRSFLRGLLSAPFVAKAEWLMRVRPVALQYMPGDLVNFKLGMWKSTGVYAVCEPVVRVEGQRVVILEPGFGSHRKEISIAGEWCELFHGLPGNRVNNPSMRPRLIRRPGTLGLCYPEDIAPEPEIGRLAQPAQESGEGSP